MRINEYNKVDNMSDDEVFLIDGELRGTKAIKYDSLMQQIGNDILTGSLASSNGVLTSASQTVAINGTGDFYVPKEYKGILVTEGNNANATSMFLVSISSNGNTKLATAIRAGSITVTFPDTDTMRVKNEGTVQCTAFVINLNKRAAVIQEAPLSS